MTFALAQGRISGLWPEFLFLQDYVTEHYWGHTWSLAVEEQFYILLPLLLLLLARKRLHWIPAIAVLLLAACLVMRYQASVHAINQVPIAYPAHLRFDSLFAGVTLSYLFHFRRNAFNALSGGWMLLASLVLLIPLAIQGQGLRTLPVVLTFNTLGFAGLLCWIVSCPIRRRAIEWIGVFSYSIYLWHYFLVILFRRYQPSFGVFWLYVACCILLGVGTAKLVEFPVLRLRDRLFAGEAR